MTPADEVQISAGDWPYRIAGLIISGFLVAVAGRLIIFDMGADRWSWAFFLLFVTLGIGEFSLWAITPPRSVWLGDRGVRISDGRSESLIPYESIASVRYPPFGQKRIVRVLIERDFRPELGRGFDLAPRKSLIEWFNPLRPDAVVIELRRRVEAARSDIAKSKSPGGPSRHSPMADEELDGPL